MFHYVSSTRSYRLTYIQGEQHNIMVYKNNNRNNNNNMCKMMSITNSEPYGSAGACNNVQNFSLRESVANLELNAQPFCLKGEYVI